MSRRFIGVMMVGAVTALLALSARAEESISISAADGKAISGLLYGTGETALILCHGRGYKTGAASFKEQCVYLKSKGMMCLALSFRGYPSESPPTLANRELDILAAVDFLVRRGAKRVFVLGSSMGGFVALKALQRLEEKESFAGLIIVSAYDATACASSSTPKLFIAAEDDKAYYAGVMATFEKAACPKQMIAYRVGGHGQSIFNVHGQASLEQILAFTGVANRKNGESTHARPDKR